MQGKQSLAVSEENGTMVDRDDHQALGVFLGLSMARAWRNRSWQYGLGFMPEAAVGMGAHLGMDACTPDGIRLLNRSL